MGSEPGPIHIFDMITTKHELERIILPDADVSYYTDFITEQEAKALFDRLIEETDWKEETITLFGKKYKQPRLTAWYGEKNKNYSYSGIKMTAIPFTSTLLKLKSQVEAFTKESFNSVLLNLYRDGYDSNGWHCDDEKELGINPVIASLSFGAIRVFKLKHKTDPNAKLDIKLENGSLLVMKGETQHYWKHQIPKTRKIVAPRINLTFRTIK